MSSEFDASLKKNIPSGMYQLTTDNAVEALQRACQSEGFSFYVVHGENITNGGAFLDQLSKVHLDKYPDWAGTGWDATLEILTDLDFFPSEKSRIILFEDFQFLAYDHWEDFVKAIHVMWGIPYRLKELLRHPLMKEKSSYRVYSLLRGDFTVLERLPSTFLPVLPFE